MSRRYSSKSRRRENDYNESRDDSYNDTYYRNDYYNDRPGLFDVFLNCADFARERYDDDSSYEYERSSRYDNRISRKHNDDDYYDRRNRLKDRRKGRDYSPRRDKGRGYDSYESSHTSSQSSTIDKRKKDKNKSKSKEKKSSKKMEQKKVKEEKSNKSEKMRSKSKSKLTTSEKQDDKVIRIENSELRNIESRSHVLSVDSRNDLPIGFNSFPNNLIPGSDVGVSDHLHPSHNHPSLNRNYNQSGYTPDVQYMNAGSQLMPTPTFQTLTQQGGFHDYRDPSHHSMMGYQHNSMSSPHINVDSQMNLQSMQYPRAQRQPNMNANTQTQVAIHQSLKDTQNKSLRPIKSVPSLIESTHDTSDTVSAITMMKISPDRDYSFPSNGTRDGNLYFVSNSINQRRKEVFIPPGDMSIILSSTPNGLMVERMSERSVAKDRLQAGDILVALDGVDISRFSAKIVAQILHKRKDNIERHIVYIPANLS